MGHGKREKDMEEGIGSKMTMKRWLSPNVPSQMIYEKIDQITYLNLKYMNKQNATIQ